MTAFFFEGHGSYASLRIIMIGAYSRIITSKLRLSCGIIIVMVTCVGDLAGRSPNNVCIYSSFPATNGLRVVLRVSLHYEEDASLSRLTTGCHAGKIDSRREDFVFGMSQKKCGQETRSRRSTSTVIHHLVMCCTIALRDIFNELARKSGSMA